MGIFDLGFDVPDANGWESRVTPGGADPNNLSLAERIRATLTGSTDPSKQGSNVAGTVGKMFGAAAGPKPAAAPQQAAAAPPIPAKPGIDPQLLASLGKSPFAAAPAGPPRPKIYQTGQPQSPFGAA